jgi:hypothetical protein
MIRTKSPQHIPLYPDTPPKTRSVVRGKRFVEKVLDTGKKVDPLRYANPRIPKEVGSRTAPLQV